MHTETSLRLLIREARHQPIPHAIPRDLTLAMPRHGLAIGITGVRRIGKTFLLYHTMHTLINQGKKREDLVYLSFEDPLLQPFTAHDLRLLITLARKENPHTIFFFDEIQEVTDWHSTIRWAVEQGIPIYLTGSSAHLFSHELPTKLRGRILPHTLFPLSLTEYARFTNQSITPSLLTAYLHDSTYPSVTLAKKEEKKSLLLAYRDATLYRDLIERYALRNPLLLERLFTLLTLTPAGMTSLSRLHGRLKQEGLRVSWPTLAEYLTLLDKVGIIHILRPARREQRVLKILLHDHGYHTLFTPLPNLARVRENLVGIHLLRLGVPLTIHPDDACDYITPTHCINVTSILTDETLVREHRFTREAQRLGKKTLLIYEDIHTSRTLTTPAIPLIDFLQLTRFPPEDL